MTPSPPKKAFFFGGGGPGYKKTPPDTPHFCPLSPIARRHFILLERWVGDGRAMAWLSTENYIILYCLIIVKLQTYLSDKSNFPFKNLFFNCYFFICSKSFSVVSECFIHNIAILLYLPQKIHRLPISHCLIINHRLPARPSPARPSPKNSIARPSPIARQHFILLRGGLFVPWCLGCLNLFWEIWISSFSRLG